MKKIVVLFVPLIFSFIVMAQSKVNQAKTINGIAEGTLEKSGIVSFKGIPFAAPPVGDLRWKEPQPVKNWEGV
ncbi:MAG: carboxylesterase family protein, partial [Chitinophagaceae bacterium]|nr:carboxylesterase family protein [Chitinophagaceae bacterium]